MMRAANFLLNALLIICGMASSHALEMPFPTRELPFAVKDSKLEGALNNGGAVKWMDNDRVIFSSSKPGAKPEDKRYPTGETSQIVIWDTTKDSVTVYADGFLQCYSDGRVIYQISYGFDGGLWTEKRRVGEMGKEQDMSLSWPGSPPLERGYNNYSCNSYSSLGYTTWQEIYRPQSSFNVARLHEDHGYLDLYTKQKLIPGVKFYRENDYPIKYYRPGQPPIELGIVRGGITGRPVFSKYANAYVLDQLIPDRRSVEASQPHQFPVGPPAVHLLSPEGEITTLTYPDALYQITTAYRINISRAGLLIAAAAGERFNPSWKTTGLFLARGEKVVKLVNDYVRSAEVSPDGCKVVFRHGITDGAGHEVAGRPYTAKMINVCSGTN
jgi:hypothetical protein